MFIILHFTFYILHFTFYILHFLKFVKLKICNIKNIIQKFRTNPTYITVTQRKAIQHNTIWTQ